MDKKGKIATISALVIAISVVALMVYAAPKLCNNGADDDGDGLTDYPNDPGCSSAQDNTETGTAICDNGVDEANDADNLADYRVSGGDPGCSSVGDSSEIDGDCDDLADNDNDGLTDLSDAGCTSTSDSSELGTAACDNGVDEANDADTLADYRVSGGDPGCFSVTDTSERDGQCDDTTDNDGDSLTDYPTDPECAGYGDFEHDCTDSDFGQDKYTQGTVSGSFGGTPFNSTDFCADSVTVTEFYCTENIQSINLSCLVNATSCVSGACV